MEMLKELGKRLEFVSDDSGQGFIEYVVLVSLVLFAATGVYLLLKTVRERFIDANTRLETLPYE
jgi:Flp pilus assembly pilin Flp